MRRHHYHAPHAMRLGLCGRLWRLAGSNTYFKHRFAALSALLPHGRFARCPTHAAIAATLAKQYLPCRPHGINAIRPVETAVGPVCPVSQLEFGDINRAACTRIAARATYRSRTGVRRGVLHRGARYVHQLQRSGYVAYRGTYPSYRRPWRSDVSRARVRLAGHRIGHCTHGGQLGTRGLHQYVHSRRCM